MFRKYAAACTILQLFVLVMAVKKPYQLLVLDMISVTNNGAADGTSCRAAQQIAIDTANNRTDFLSNYEIVPQFVDEAGGQLTAKRVVEYLRSFENGGNSAYYQSPVIVGSLFSGGCKAMGRFLHFQNSININVACAAPFLTDRRLYPNLYMMRSTGRVLSLAQMRFIKEVGHWNRIAIITYAENIFDYVSATFLQQLAVEKGVELPLFDYVIDVTADTMGQIKQTDSRVIVFFCSMAKMIWKFLCETYRNEVTGSRYVFIILGVQFSDPYNIPTNQLFPGCTREIIIEQLQFTFVTAPVMYTDAPLVKTHLGYDTIEFDRMFDRYTNKSRPVDYEFRFLCHDTVLQSLITLDNAEQSLNRKNLTLRNFTDSPKIVMEKVNRSAYEIDYVGLRMGKMRYNSRGEVDADLQMISQWSPGESLQYVYLVRQFPNASGFNYADYWVSKVREPKWMTPSKSPPQDKWQDVVLLVEVGEDYQIPITIIAALFGAIQIAIGFRVITPTKENGQEVQTYSISKCIPYLACVLLDISAALYVSKNNAGKSIWEARIATLLLGFGLLVASFFSRTIFILNKVRKAAKIYHLSTNTFVMANRRTTTVRGSSKNTAPVTGQNATNETDQTVSYSAIFTKEILAKLEKLSLVSIFALFALNGVYLVVWLVVDPVKCRIFHLTQQPIYDLAEDTLTDSQAVICNSRNQAAWAYSAAAFDVALFILACYMAWKLHSVKWIGFRGRRGEFNLIGLAALNATTVLIGTWLILVIIDEAISQQITVAISCLFVSGGTSSLLFSSQAVQDWKRFIRQQEL